MAIDEKKLIAHLETLVAVSQDTSTAKLIARGVQMCIDRIKLQPKVGEWIPVSSGMLPKTDTYILLSFENFSLPEIGRYEEDSNGGAFYVGDDDKSCAAYGLFVNAWMPMFENYKGEQE